MTNHRILVTGGAGFLGSSIALRLKSRRPNARITSFDNLRRRGSELQIARLREGGVEFVHGDVRNIEDFAAVEAPPTLIVDCAADPSVMAGQTGSARQVIGANLLGTVNCLELAKEAGARVIFISTSRVYSIGALNALRTEETETRYALLSEQSVPGASSLGVTEDFPTQGVRSLYGTTKLSSELIIQEYGGICGLEYIINRCGVIAGPWQMGRVDQGVAAFWLAKHYFGEPLAYIGWGGLGKQVRDVLDIRDFLSLLEMEVEMLPELSGQVFNVGGGLRSTVSLKEMTTLCEEITGKTVAIERRPQTRSADVKVYVTDNSRVADATGWSPVFDVRQTLESIHEWLIQHEAEVRPLLSSREKNDERSAAAPFDRVRACA